MHWDQRSAPSPMLGLSHFLLCKTRQPFSRSHWLALLQITIWSCSCITENLLQSVLWWRKETLLPLQVSSVEEGTQGHLWVSGNAGVQGDSGDCGMRGFIGLLHGRCSGELVGVLGLQGGVLGTLWCGIRSTRMGTRNFILGLTG